MIERFREVVNDLLLFICKWVVAFWYFWSSWCNFICWTSAGTPSGPSSLHRLASSALRRSSGATFL
eukprot:2962018-Amphidinium_carterae.1